MKITEVLDKKVNGILKLKCISSTSRIIYMDPDLGQATNENVLDMNYFDKDYLNIKRIQVTRQNDKHFIKGDELIHKRKHQSPHPHYCSRNQIKSKIWKKQFIPKQVFLKKN